MRTKTCRAWVGVMFLFAIVLVGCASPAPAQGVGDTIRTANEAVSLTRSAIEVTSKAKNLAEVEKDPQVRQTALVKAAQTWFVPDKMTPEENDMLSKMMLEQEQQDCITGVTVGVSGDFYNAIVNVDRQALYEKLRGRIRTLDAAKIISWAGSPRVVVIVDEMLDGKESSPSYGAEAQIQQSIQKMGFDLVSKRQMAEVKEVEVKIQAESSLSDKAFLTTLAERYDAEIVVFCRVEATQRGFAPMSGNVGVATETGIYTYNASMGVEVAETSTAKVLAPLFFSWVPKAPAGISREEQDTLLSKYGRTSKEGAARAAVEFLMNEHSQDIANGIIDALMTLPPGYELVVKQAPREWRTDLIKALSAIKGIKKVDFRMYSGRSLHLRIQTEDDITEERIVEILSAMEEFPMVLDTEMPRRLTFAAQDKGGTAKPGGKSAAE